MNKVGGTTLPGGRVSRQSQRVREFGRAREYLKPLLWKYLHIVDKNLTVYIRNVISFYVISFLKKKKKKKKNPIFGTLFFGENSILAYISL